MRTLVPMVVVYLLAGAKGAEASETPGGTLRAQEGGRVVDVPLERTEVRLRVSGFLVDAEVTQVFVNPMPRKIEALYLFPLPENAAVNELDLEVGERRVRGEIRRREEARRVYQRARRAGQVAALLEQQRPNLFTQKVANLEPGARVKVRIRYLQPLAQDDGGYELVFPMVAPPRYLPPAAAREPPEVQPQVLPPGMRSSHTIRLAVELDAGVPLADLASPSHRVEVRSVRGDPRAEVVLAPGDTVPNKDFVLRWRVAGAAPAFAVLSHREEGHGSFYLFAQPPRDAAPAQVAPREVVVVVDTSSSMKGPALAKAQEVVARVLGGLRPDDTFQIVRFDDRASALGPRPIASRRENVERALAWLAALPARGGTLVTSGIDAALALPHDPGRLRLVVFVTDGFVGNEDEILARVQERMGDARLFAFGVGAAANRWLLEEMAALGRGTASFVRADEDASAAIERFQRRIDRAVLTDVTIDWGGLPVSDVTPSAAPDLFLGQPLVLSGHYARAASGVVTIRGRQGLRQVSFAVPVTLPERRARPAVAGVWARARISELSRRLLRKEEPAIVEEVTRLALAHRLLSRYTAFVAVDTSGTTAGGEATPVTVPVEVPEGVMTGSLVGYGVGGGGMGLGTIGVGSYGTIGHGSGYGGVSYGVAYGAARVVSAPRVVLAPGAVSGGDLDKNLIRRTVRAQLPRIKHCYERELVVTPTLRATAVAKFMIAADGHVLVVSVDGTGREAMENCMSDVIHDLQFPATPGGGLVQVSYPFQLKPEE